MDTNEEGANVKAINQQQAQDMLALLTAFLNHAHSGMTIERFRTEADAVVARIKEDGRPA